MNQFKDDSQDLKDRLEFLKSELVDAEKLVRETDSSIRNKDLELVKLRGLKSSTEKRVTELKSEIAKVTLSLKGNDMPMLINLSKAWNGLFWKDEACSYLIISFPFIDPPPSYTGTWSPQVHFYKYSWKNDFSFFESFGKTKYNLQEFSRILKPLNCSDNRRKKSLSDEIFPSHIIKTKKMKQLTKEIQNLLQYVDAESVSKVIYRRVLHFAEEKTKTTVVSKKFGL